MIQIQKMKVEGFLVVGVYRNLLMVLLVGCRRRRCVFESVCLYRTFIHAIADCLVCVTTVSIVINIMEFFTFCLIINICSV